MDIYVVAGRPGAGKSTFLHILASYIYGKVNIVCTGDLIRNFASIGSKEAIRVRECMLKGEKVDSRIVDNLIFQEIEDDEVVVLDGYPRDTRQLCSLINDLRMRQGRTFINLHFVEINTMRELAITRMLRRGRDDDIEETVKKRQDYFDSTYEDMVNYDLTAAYDNVIINVSVINGEHMDNLESGAKKLAEKLIKEVSHD